MPLQNVARVFFYATETPHVLSVQYLLNNSSETPALNAGLDQEDEAPPTTTPTPPLLLLLLLLAPFRRAAAAAAAAG